MATITRENIGTLHDKITVSLTKEDYMPSFEMTLKQQAKQVTMPGFRKGNVPAGMVRKMYGPSIFGDEVFRSDSKQLEEYMKEQQMSFLGQPMMMEPEADMKMDMNAPSDVKFAFEIGLRPDFTIPALDEKRTLTQYKVTAGDKMLDDEIERIRRRYGNVEDQANISDALDIIYATYEMSDADGNPLAGSQRIEDTVQFDKYPQKLQDMLMGKATNDTIVFRPSDVAEGEELQSLLKGSLKADESVADFNFKLTLTKIGKLIPRDLDADLFAQVYPNDFITTEEAFRDRLRQDISREFDRIAANRMNDEIFEMLVHTTPIELPVPFLKKWLQTAGEKPVTAEQVEKDFPAADHQLRWTLISDKVMQDNDIRVDFKEVVAFMKTQVLGYFGMDADEEPEWLQGYMEKMAKDKKAVDQTYQQLLQDKLFGFLRSQFNVEEKEVTEEEFFALPNAHAAHHHDH